MLAIFSLHSSGLETSNVASSKGLRDGQANGLLARQNLGDDFSLDGVATEVEDRRKTNNRARHETIAVTSASSASELLCDDQLWTARVRMRGLPPLWDACTSWK